MAAGARSCEPAIVADEVVDAGHPCLAGHFPGRPIVPAVVLLERVMAIAGSAAPELRITGVSEAKFVRPVLPGRRFAIRLETPRPGRIAFEIAGDGDILARGRLIVQAGA